MSGDPAAALRERARAWGQARLAEAPWAPLERQLTLLLVDPPAAAWASIDEGNASALWLVIAGPEVRTLPSDHREALGRDGSTHEHLVASRDDPAVDWSIFAVERLEGVLQGVGRRSLETRWSVRQAEPLHDPLRRHDQLAAAAARLPDDGLERIVRPLYLQTHTALSALQRTGLEPARAAVAAGEAAGAVARLSCVLDAGMHPPSHWLLPAAARTELGGRLVSWLDDLPRALGGDEGAARRALDGCDAVMRTVEAALRPHFGAADWLRWPDAVALRPPR